MKYLNALYLFLIFFIGSDGVFAVTSDQFQSALIELEAKSRENPPEQFFVVCGEDFKSPRNWSDIEDITGIEKVAISIEKETKGKSDCKLSVTVDGEETSYPISSKELSVGPPNAGCGSLDSSWAKEKFQKDYYIGTAIAVFDKDQLCFYEYYPRGVTGSGNPYKNISRLAVGDNILIGSTTDVSVDFTACSPISAETRPLKDDNETDGEQAAANIQFQSRVYNCEAQENKIIIRDAEKKTLYEETIKQQQRYRGTFQVGMSWMSLNDQTYNTFDYGDGAVIRAEKGDERHPVYTGSFVLYGFPHYLTSFQHKGSAYLGRDLLNDNQFFDRIGLAFTLGLSKPEDLLGVGLSFELAPGINFTYSKLWKKVNKLDGFDVGDQFSGQANTIPIKESWENENVAGLSIDARYLAKFFSTGK